MAWNYDLNKPEQELIWDLRQTYAEIISEVLKRIAESRYNKDYGRWFEALEDLYIEINQKLDKKEREEHKKIRENTIETLAKHSAVYNKKDQSPEKVFIIYSSLRSMELWLKLKMEKHRMFGAKEEPELL